MSNDGGISDLTEDYSSEEGSGESSGDGSGEGSGEGSEEQNQRLVNLPLPQEVISKLGKHCQVLLLLNYSFSYVMERLQVLGE